MRFPWHLFPKRQRPPIVVDFAVEDLTFVHIEPNGTRHDIPRHIAEILNVPELLEEFPDESEFVHYMDSKGHIHKLPRKGIKFPEPPWGWNGARSALLSESGPRSRSDISRGQAKWKGAPRRIRRKANS